MFCRYCGAELPEDAVICPRCGGAVTPDVPAEDTHRQDRPEQMERREETTYHGAYGTRQNQGYYGPQFHNGDNRRLEEIRHAANVTLAWGIVSVFCSLTIYLSLLGVIFSVLGFVKAKRYRELAGPETGSALAGKILSIIGLCSGIVMTIVFFIIMGYVAYVMF